MSLITSGLKYCKLLLSVRAGSLFEFLKSYHVCQKLDVLLENLGFIAVVLFAVQNKL